MPSKVDIQIDERRSIPIVNADLLDRLVCAKFLFRTGIDALEREGPFSAGLGVLLFHDAVELGLRAVVAQLQAKATDQMPFSQLLDCIDETGAAKVPYRTELLKLNRMRVSFKHAAILPHSDDIRKIQHSLDAFFAALALRFFALDFDDVSLVGLVRHTRTANWLRAAEGHLSHSEYDLAVEASAKAFAVFMNSRMPQRRYLNLLSNLRATESRGAGSQDINARKAMSKLAHDTEEEFQQIWDQLDLIATGVNLADYGRFRDLAPRVRLSQAQTFWILNHGRSGPIDYEDASFCVSFAISTILKAQQQYRKPGWTIGSKRIFRVNVDTQVILFPNRDESENETICVASTGTTLNAPTSDYDNKEAGYTAVLHDDQIVYVKTEALSELPIPDANS